MTNQEITLAVNIDDSLSLEELQARRDEGFSVLRSAHVGNFMPYNSTIAEMGFSMLLVDHTITGIDTTYVPEAIITTRSKKIIAEAGQLVCRCLAGDQYLDEVQVNATKEVFPGTKIFTNTEYLRANEKVAGEIVMIASQFFPDIFKRKIVSGDRVEQIPKKLRDNFADLVPRIGVMQLSDDPRTVREAVMVPNEVDIVINFVIEALEKERDIIYHLSGPAMVEYINNKDIARAITGIYSKVKELASFRNKLPNQLKVALIPSANARFATTKERSANLIDLINVLGEFTIERAKLNAERKHFFTDSSKSSIDKKSAAGRFNEKHRSLLREAAVVAIGLDASGVFAGVSDGQVTQYDIPDEGGLFVASENTELSMSDLAEISKLLKKIIEVPL